MKRTVLAGLFSSLFLTTCGVKPYNQSQYTACFQTYSETFNTCSDDDCKSEALETYRNCTGENVKIPIHFVVLTEKLAQNINLAMNPGTKPKLQQGSVGQFSTVKKKSVTDFLKTRIDTLNRYFTVENTAYPPDNREKIVTFEYKSATLFAQALVEKEPLTDFAIPQFDFDERKTVFIPALNSTNNSRLYDPEAVNVYIVDAIKKDSQGVIEDVTSSHGNNNNNRPYIVLDYARITGKADRVAAEEHEMGHAFGLAHTCDPNAKKDDDTNIMGSSHDYPTDNACEYESGVPQSTCKDSVTSKGWGGNRSIGFSPCQCKVILEKVNAFLANI